MITLNAYSVALGPLRTNLDLFGTRISDNSTTSMDGVVDPSPSHSSIRLTTPKLQRQMSPQNNCYSSENSRSNSFCDIESKLTSTSVTTMHSIDPKFSIAALVSNEDMASCETRSNATPSYGHTINTSESNEDAYTNYCSDDSELSVGNETVGGTTFEHVPNSNNTSGAKRSISHQRQDSSLDQLYYQSKMPDIIRPSLTRQEEFLRRSQIYAGEILKHQFNFMSVTKGLNISPKMHDTDTMANSIKLRSSSPTTAAAAAAVNSVVLPSPLKIGLSRLQVYANDMELDKKWSVIEERSIQAPTNFREIHSHLNAISRITSALEHDNNTHIRMVSPNSSTSRENSESPLSTNASTVRNVLRNNLNDTNLKFSIDNILKPSFGRRITDPLHKLSNKAIRKSEQKRRDSAERVERISTFDDTMFRTKV